jgi:hypothetical protein
MARIIKDYVVLEANTPFGLGADVETYSRRGCVPQGGVTKIYHSMGLDEYIQAMVKYKEE